MAASLDEVASDTQKLDDIQKTFSDECTISSHVNDKQDDSGDKNDVDKEVPFAVGQVWEYDCRPQDNGSLLKIIKIETEEDVYGPNANLEDKPDDFGPRFVHISVEGVNLYVGEPDTGIPKKLTNLGHVPLMECIVRKCVTKLIRVEQGPFDLEGYYEFTAARKTKGAGWFTIPVKECVECIQKAFLGGQVSKEPQTPPPDEGPRLQCGIN